MKKEQQQPITIRDLYPHLNEVQLREAEENFERYIEVALEIYDDICANPSPVEKKALTAPLCDHTIDRKRSSPTKSFPKSN